jgi:hypothetical protein
MQSKISSARNTANLDNVVKQEVKKKLITKAAKVIAVSKIRKRIEVFDIT